MEKDNYPDCICTACNARRAEAEPGVLEELARAKKIIGQVLEHGDFAGVAALELMTACDILGAVSVFIEAEL